MPCSPLATGRLRGNGVHTLKGSASTLGATDVAQKATDLEQAILSDLPPEQLEAMLEQLGRALQCVMHDIKAHLQDPPEDAPPTPSTPADALLASF